MRREVMVILLLSEEGAPVSYPKGIGDVASRLTCTRHAAEFCGFIEGSAMANRRSGLVGRSNAKRVVLEAAVAGMGRRVVGMVE